MSANNAHPQSAGERRHALLSSGLLALGLLILMLDRLTQNPLHEWIAVALSLMVLQHVRTRFGWFRWSLRRLRDCKTLPASDAARLLCHEAGNLATGLLFIAAVLSGSLVSQTVFAGIIPDDIRNDLNLRSVHVMTSCWLLIATAPHVGWRRRPKLEGRAMSALAIGSAAAVLICVGLLLSDRDPLSLLTGSAAYIPVTRDEWIGALPLDIVLAFAGPAAAAALGAASLRRTERRQA